MQTHSRLSAAFFFLPLLISTVSSKRMLNVIQPTAVESAAKMTIFHSGDFSVILTAVCEHAKCKDAAEKIMKNSAHSLARCCFDACVLALEIPMEILWKFRYFPDIFRNIYNHSSGSFFGCTERVSESENGEAKKKESNSSAAARRSFVYLQLFALPVQTHTTCVWAASRSRESFNFIWSIYHLAKHTKSREKNGSIMTMMIAFFRVSFRKIPQSTRHCSAIVYVE